MTRIVGLVAAAALVVFLIASVWLGRLERTGPAHAELMLEGGIPATLYLPAEDAGLAAFLDPPPREERPPAVALMHGFAGDRLSLSSLARRLAGSGYAVLAFDAAGHGQNRNPYTRSRERADSFHSDFRAAVDFLRTYPFVDGSRLAVMGQSMGAIAALDFATRDSGLDAAVMISGGRSLEGPYRPPNALFIYAESDRESRGQRARELAGRLAGVDELEVGPSYGHHRRQDAVRAVEVADASHVTIVWSGMAVGEIVAWLDASFGIDRGEKQTPHDPRLAAAGVLAFAFVLVLPGVGLLVGRLVPRGRELPGDGRPLGLLALALAFSLSLPLLALGPPAAIVSLEVGDAIVSQFALAGIALLLAIGWRRPELLEGLWSRPLATLTGAAIGLVAVFSLMHPVTAVVHRLTLTPERMLAFALAALGLVLLALPFNLLLRRGGVASSTLFALAGRALIIAVLVAGVWLGVLHHVVLLMLPALAVVSFVFEALAASLYAASRNLLAVALIDAGWLALVFAAILPIRI